MFLNVTNVLTKRTIALQLQTYNFTFGAITDYPLQ